MVDLVVDEPIDGNEIGDVRMGHVVKSQGSALHCIPHENMNCRPFASTSERYTARTASYALKPHVRISPALTRHAWSISVCT